MVLKRNYKENDKHTHTHTQIHTNNKNIPTVRNQGTKELPWPSRFGHLSAAADLPAKVGFLSEELATKTRMCRVYGLVLLLV